MSSFASRYRKLFIPITVPFKFSAVVGTNFEFAALDAGINFQGEKSTSRSIYLLIRC